MKNRNYPCKDVEMLSAAQTITQNLLDNIGELSVLRMDWTPEYVNSLLEKINKANQDFLGQDRQKALRDASSELHALQTPALRDLSMLKVQIEVGFKDQSANILKNLGYNRFYAPAAKGKQEKLVELLFAAKKGLSAKLKALIVEKGIKEEVLDRIITYADQMNSANVTQELMKSRRSGLTSEARESYNEIYEEIVGVCKIASRFYRDNPLKRNLFSFSRIVRNLSSGAKSRKNEAADQTDTYLDPVA
jgi:hypothetical protein